MTYHLGVDLGTTYTAAALCRQGRAEPATLDTRSVAIPSVVYQAGNELLVGQPAARRAVTEPSRVAREFKRRVGDPTPILLGGSPVPAELLMARLLDWVVHQVSTSEGAAPASLAVTHPANWGEYKLDLLRQAIRHVDLHADHLVPEPVAAASFYAAVRDLAVGSTVAVYDLGGGTFDAAVVRIEADGPHIVGRPDGVERLGGVDFDHAVFHHVARSLDLDLDGEVGEAALQDPALVAGLAQLRQDCVDAKEALSTETDVSIPVLLPMRHTEVRLTRSEFEAMIRPALDETLVALRRAVVSAGVAVEDLHVVLLVGGSSRIPMVAHMVTAELGRPAAVDARPKDAIPLGAALVAWQAAEAASAAQASVPAPVVVPAPPTLPEAPTPVRHLPPPPLAPPSGRRPTPAATPTASGAAPGHTAEGGAKSSRAWLVAAVAVLVAVAAVTALVLGQNGGESNDGDDPDVAGPTTENSATDDTTEDPSSDDPDDTASSDDADDSTSAGDGPPAALPGDDWNEAAREQFVQDCSNDPTMSAAAGQGAEDFCGCLYDDISTQGLTLQEFNEQWTAEDIDTSSPAADAINSAVFNCVGTDG